MYVEFSNPTTSTWCDGCGESYSQCRCDLDTELLREGPGWNQTSWVADDDLADMGMHIWDGDRPPGVDDRLQPLHTINSALAEAGFIRTSKITDKSPCRDHEPCGDDFELDQLNDWLLEMGYQPTRRR